MTQNGTMVWWRFVRGPSASGVWRFGYVSRLGNGLIRMGAWNGDTDGGKVVSESEIETKPYS